MWKQDDELVLIWRFMVSEESTMTLRCNAWFVGVGGVPRSVGHQESSQVEQVEPRMRTSVFSEFSLRQLFFIQVATAFILLWKLLLAIVGSLVRERIS